MPASDVEPPPGESPRNWLVVVSWISLGLTLALALTSFLSYAIWLLPFPVALVAFIVGITVLKRRGKSQAISLLVAAILIIPVSFLAQCVSLAIYGASAMREQIWQETQMLENLRTIGKAKEQWIAGTQARNGARVTMANLTSYLNGTEVKPVVGERYEPKPVGQEPTATLPEGKHLWNNPIRGTTYTVSGLEPILAQSWFNPIDLATGELLHPSGRWFPTFWKTVPRTSASPANSPTLATPPKPKTSPDSTARETPSATPDDDED